MTKNRPKEEPTIWRRREEWSDDKELRNDLTTKNSNEEQRKNRNLWKNTMKNTTELCRCYLRLSWVREI